MKKVILLFICLYIAKITNAQPWEIGLNNISPGQSGNLGTLNAENLNFFTNNQRRITIDKNGYITFHDFAGGAGNRFLQVNNAGLLTSWEGSVANMNKVLFGDNTWRSLPFTTSGNSIYSGTGTKVGIGISAPETELDVDGGAQVKNGLRVGEGLYLGGSDNYGLIRYTPGTANSPAVFNFGGGGTANPNNPSPGNPYNLFNGGHGGGGSESPDPQPDVTCINGVIPSMAVFQNLLCIQKKSTVVPPAIATSLGNINLGHDGTNAFIETQGTNPLFPNAGDLYINSRCNRNVYLFSNGSSFAPTTDHVMSVAGRMNVTQNMQIGGGTSTTNFNNNTAQLYIHSNSSTGIQVRHGNGIAGLHLIELADNSKGIAIYRGTPTADGTERFSVLGDGKTTINTTSSDALVISDANTSQVNFQVKSTGSAFLGGGISGVANSMLVVGMPIPTYKALAIVDNSNLPNIKDVFSVYGNGYTEIRSTATKAFALFNATSNNETFSINNNGYVDIKVYSPTGMPVPSYPSSSPTITNPRVITVRDMSSNNKDVFVVRADGKVYAREIEINLTQNFPDYVFKSEYNLLTIKELRDYIKTNKHLPGFEKGEHYEQNGINVNHMIIKQQEKIEELTLYIIQIEERMNKLESIK